MKRREKNATVISRDDSQSYYVSARSYHQWRIQSWAMFNVPPNTL